jgi:hypothetical protein
VKSVVSPEPDNDVLEQLIIAGREMEEQGCRAVIGACGYFAKEREFNKLIKIAIISIGYKGLDFLLII